VQLPAEALANVWWPVRLKAIETSDGNELTARHHEAIQVLWLNTTLGLLSWLALRQDTEGPWVAMKSETLRLLPLLDVSKLTGEQVQALLNLFKQFAQQELPSFPEQYAQASRGEGVKYEMDRAVLKAILGQEVDLKPLYQLLAREPILTLKPLA
jgi:hypothetical protein